MDLTAAVLAWAVGKSGTVTKMSRDRNSNKDWDELGFYWPDGMWGESEKLGQLTGEPVTLCFCTPDLTDGESHLLLIFCAPAPFLIGQRHISGLFWLAGACSNPIGKELEFRPSLHPVHVENKRQQTMFCTFLGMWPPWRPNLRLKVVQQEIFFFF